MDFVEEVLSQAARSNKNDLFSRFVATTFFFAVNIGIIYIFNGSRSLVFILICGFFLAPIIGYILGNKLSAIIIKKNSKIQFKKSKLYKRLEKKGYLSEFINTIDEEIKLENTIKYFSSILGAGLLVTKTWFVYIDFLHPKVVKTEDILKISEELSSKNSTHYLCLQLKNNTYLKIKKIFYEDIENEIKIKYPNIMIGTGIIDDE